VNTASPTADNGSMLHVWMNSASYNGVHIQNVNSSGRAGLSLHSAATTWYINNDGSAGNLSIYGNSDSGNVQFIAGNSATKWNFLNPSSTAVASIDSYGTITGNGLVISSNMNNTMGISITNSQTGIANANANSAKTVLTLLNSASTTNGLSLFLNSYSTNTAGTNFADGGANAATLRNSLGSLRLQGSNGVTPANSNSGLIINNNGLVGIGTTNPTSALHVVGATTLSDTTLGTTTFAKNVWHKAVGDAIGRLYFGDSASFGTIFGTGPNTAGYVWRSSTDANIMSLSNGGNLVVTGTLTATGGTTALAGLSAGATTLSSTLGVSGTTTLVGLSAGATTLSTLGVSGATTLSSTLTVTGLTTCSGGLTVTGTITASGDITAFTSDARMKTNIRNIDNALDKLQQIRGVYYHQSDLAAHYGFSNYQQQVGVIAQEVKEVLPEVIRPAPFDNDGNGGSKSGENYMTVQYDKIVPLLINAIKEQQVQIQEQQVQINELKSMIQVLCSKNI